MSARADLPPALRALVETGVALARRSSTAQVAIARAADVVDVEALPAPLRRRTAQELAAAVEQTCEPLAPKQVEKALREAWGRAPGKVLDDLDLDAPLAVRPAAQVHRAHVDGTAVAVKVQRPGLASAARSDLALLDALAGPLRAVVPRADAGAFLREIRIAALDDLDLEHEASTQRSVARALRRVEGLVVPKAYGELCAPSVLVTELLDGPTLRDGAPEDPAALAQTLVEAHLVAARDAGLALTDPRPGHVVLMPDGRVGLLGAGLARPIDRRRVAAALDALLALHAGDPEAFATAVCDGLEVLPADHARRAHDLLRQIAGKLLAGPVRLDAGALAGAAARALDRAGSLADLAAKTTPHPEDLWPLRGAAQLVGVLARLEVSRDWAALVAPA